MLLNLLLLAVDSRMKIENNWHFLGCLVLAHFSGDISINRFVYSIALSFLLVL